MRAEAEGTSAPGVWGSRRRTSAARIDARSLPSPRRDEHQDHSQSTAQAIASSLQAAPMWSRQPASGTRSIELKAAGAEVDPAHVARVCIDGFFECSQYVARRG